MEDFLVLNDYKSYFTWSYVLHLANVMLSCTVILLLVNCKQEI
jgi:hypothetical protein